LDFLKYFCNLSFFAAVTAVVSLHNQIASTCCVITCTISKIDALESDIISTKTDISCQKKKIFFIISIVHFASIWYQQQATGWNVIVKVWKESVYIFMISDTGKILFC